MAQSSVQKKVKIFSGIFISVLIALFLTSFVVAKPTHLPLPQQAKGGNTFFLEVNNAIQWEGAGEVFQLQLQLVEADRALINLYISGKISRFFVQKGTPLKLDVTEDGQEDGTITLVDIKGTRAELLMTSTTEGAKKIITQPSTQQNNQQTTTLGDSQLSSETSDTDGNKTFLYTGLIIGVIIILIIGWVIWRKRSRF